MGFLRVPPMPTLPKDLAGLIKGLLTPIIIRPAVETTGNVAFGWLRFP